ncbi:MAG: phosphate signaling complex protein PhoU [Oscillospiraceae bacterium]|nr:phosphate signaling complex protein PhoU [Oscillospiraceae bacterium]
MRTKFDGQLSQLNVELIRMGALCEEAISDACKALLEGNVQLADSAKELEREIDQKERNIESLCMRLLLQQQPVARDLRTISSALKMISDMERIGDQAEDIAELTRFTREAGPVDMVHIGDMARAVVVMVTDSVDAFVKKDLDLARKVMAADDQVDALFDQVKRELIQLISTDANQGELSLDLLMVAKYLERIGDHATNIAEWVEYSLTGAHPNL